MAVRGLSYCSGLCSLPVRSICERLTDGHLEFTNPPIDLAASSDTFNPAGGRVTPNSNTTNNGPIFSMQAKVLVIRL